MTSDDPNRLRIGEKGKGKETAVGERREKGLLLGILRFLQRDKGTRRIRRSKTPPHPLTHVLLTPRRRPREKNGHTRKD